jgi:hypothetical protein
MPPTLPGLRVVQQPASSLYGRCFVLPDRLPVVLRSGGFRLFFYSNEGCPRGPRHVHGARSGSEAGLD